MRELNSSGFVDSAVDTKSDAKRPADLVHELKTMEKGKTLEFRAFRFTLEPEPVPPATKPRAEMREYLFAVLNADPRGPSYIAKFDAGTVSAYPTTEGEWKRRAITLIDARSPVTQLEVSHDRCSVAVTTTENDFYVYDTQTLKLIMTKPALHE